ncbi:MAG TPA: peptidoglycan bridge formation glycyltransferase FemA/FemB family protein [bacterium]|nr:peptidoglycan bridge formation glycyltransferase FemA/FemB family protein [bacterium]
MRIELITANTSTNCEINDFVVRNSFPAAFLQTWQWSDFRASLGEKIWRLAVRDENGFLLAVAAFFSKPLPLQKIYLDCPRGPIFSSVVNLAQRLEIIKLLANFLVKTIQRQIVFIRTENNQPTQPAITLTYTQAGFKKPELLIHAVNPAATLVLDLSKTEEEILANMHPKWRYNIKLAQKRGVLINHQHSIDGFYQLLVTTAKRDKIKIFSKKYYKNLINFFSVMPDFKLKLFFAEYEDEVLAAIMVIGFGNTAIYLHGGSSNRNREVMPNHAVQWHAIKWAKENKYQWYDFWGIATAEKNNYVGDAWTGITHFKKGFVNASTGQELIYGGAWDLVQNFFWYNFFKLTKKTKNLLTGFLPL